MIYVYLCYLLFVDLLCQVIVNGYQGTVYPGPQSERNALFRPLVAATVVQVLGGEYEFTVHGRNGEIRKGTLPPGILICYHSLLTLWH